MAHASFPVETVEELRRLVVTYAICIDLRRFDEIASLFTPDAYWDGTPQGLKRHDGRDAIHANFGSLGDRIDSSAHFVTNFLVTRLDDDEAEAIVYTIGHAWMKGAAEPRRDMVYYRDRFRRLPDEGWRIAGRTVTTLTPY